MTQTKENAMDTQKIERSGRLICIKVLTMPFCKPSNMVTPANTATMHVYIRRALKHPLRSAKLKVMC